MICEDCKDSALRCEECGRTVCSLHRIGTGALSEGYACSLGCSLKRAGVIPRNESIVQRFGPVPILAGIVVLVWSVIAALVR